MHLLAQHAGRDAGFWHSFRGRRVTAVIRRSVSQASQIADFLPRIAPQAIGTALQCIVPTANLIWGTRRPAHTCCKSDVRAIFSGNNREAREVHAANYGTKGVSGSENWNTCPGVGIAARTATFRLRVARSGDEVHQTNTLLTSLLPNALKPKPPDGHA